MGAALASARLGRRTILIAESDWLGGMMTSGGIGVFDGSPIGHSHSLTGGLFREMKQRLADLYPEHGGDITRAYRYEPAVGARVLEAMAAELPALRILRNTRLVGVEVEGERVVALRLEGEFAGVVRGDVFVDGTDAGLLAARAGVPYRLGTDDSNGLVMAYAVRGTFMKGPKAYVPFEVDPETGREIPPPHYGDNYVECVKEVAWRWALRREDGIPTEAPAAFNWWGNLPVLDPALRADHVKWDINGDANDITLDQIASQLASDPEVGWYFVDAEGEPIASRACISAVEDDASVTPMQRERIIQAIVDRVRGSCLAVLYYIRNSMRELGGAQWGLAPDYGTPDGLPPKIYRREGRRIVGQYTLTQYDLSPTIDSDLAPGAERGVSTSAPAEFDDVIAVGDYAIDFHRFTRDGRNVWFELPPYQVPYRIMAPVNRENLLVTTAVSVTHEAYGSVRVDPLRMVMGQACGTAAHVALRRPGPARTDTVPIREVQGLLVAQGVVLTYFTDVPYDIVSGGMTLDELFRPTQMLALHAGLRGYADHSFRRTELMTRAEFAKLLIALAGLAPAVPASVPADVPESHWAYESIRTALAHGALSPRAGGDFVPDAPITRGEAAVAAAALAPLSPGDPERVQALVYSDIEDAEVNRAASRLALESPEDGAPYFAGVAPGVFSPDAPLSRGRAAMLLQRAFLPLERARGRSAERR